MNALSPIPAERPAPSESEPSVRLAPARRRRWLWVVALGLAGLGAGAFAWRDAGGTAEPEVMTAKVASGTVEQAVLATGILKPSRLVAVGAQVSGG